jgi:hypothetical protein
MSLRNAREDPVADPTPVMRAGKMLLRLSRSMSTQLIWVNRGFSKQGAPVSFLHFLFQLSQCAHLLPLYVLYSHSEKLSDFFQGMAFTGLIEYAFSTF